MTATRSNPQALYDLIRLVRPLYKALEASVARELDGTGVTVSQRAILEQVQDLGAPTVPDIGRRLLLPRQYVQKIANELLDAGLIEKRSNAAHKRSALLDLTAEGAAAIAAIKAREAAVMRPIARALEAADVETARAVMTEMIGAFRSHTEGGEKPMEGDQP